MFKYQKGFTLYELIAVVWFFAVIGIIGSVTYAAFHFITKLS